MWQCAEVYPMNTPQNTMHHIGAQFSGLHQSWGVKFVPFEHLIVIAGKNRIFPWHASC
jgi:hypothetical protein